MGRRTIGGNAATVYLLHGNYLLTRIGICQVNKNYRTYLLPLHSFSGRTWGDNYHRIAGDLFTTYDQGAQEVPVYKLVNLWYKIRQAKFGGGSKCGSLIVLINIAFVELQ